jgi:hypothetical protein
MPTVTMIDDEYVSLWYHPETGIVHHKIHKYLVPGVFEKLLTAGAELLESHGATKYLSDDRSNVVVAPDDIKWAEENWYPRVSKAGLRHWALVLPSTMVGTVQARAIVEERRKKGLDVEGFDTIEAAMTWLQSR